MLTYFAAEALYSAFKESMSTTQREVGEFHGLVSDEASKGIFEYSKKRRKEKEHSSKSCF